MLTTHSAVCVFHFELSNPQVCIRVGSSFPAQLLKSTSLPSACTGACWKGPRQPLGVLQSLLLPWPFWGSDAAPCPPLTVSPVPGMKHCLALHADSHSGSLLICPEHCSRILKHLLIPQLSRHCHSGSLHKQLRLMQAVPGRQQTSVGRMLH